MPLDTSTYNLALLRLDGRRWNELRRINAQVSTQPAADGSSHLSMGNTSIICTVTGPSEQKGAGGAARGGIADRAEIRVEVSVAGFAGVDRVRRGRNDKKIIQLQTAIKGAFEETLFTHLYPHSTISLTLHVLSQDGPLLAPLINAATLALIDAGIPMSDYVVACTAGSTSSYASNDEAADPLLDLNALEEQELPYLTVATLGASDRIMVLVMETRLQIQRLEGMLAVAIDGCKQVRQIMDRVIRDRGEAMIQGELNI